MPSLKTIATTTLLALALSATAAPAAEPAGVSTIEARAINGQITYFDTSVGTGACGWQNTNHDHIVAVSAPLYDSQHPCGRRIRIYHGKGHVDVTVADRCVGCDYNNLDVTPDVFSSLFGGLGAGRVNANWNWI